MRRNVLDFSRYLAHIAALLNERRLGRSLLPVRPFRTPAVAPVASLATCPQAILSLKGRNPLEQSR